MEIDHCMDSITKKKKGLHEVKLYKSSMEKMTSKKPRTDGVPSPRELSFDMKANVFRNDI